MPGLVMIGPVVWAVGELYTQTHTHTHTNATTLYIKKKVGQLFTSRLHKICDFLAQLQWFAISGILNINPFSTSPIFSQVQKVFFF